MENPIINSYSRRSSSASNSPEFEFWISTQQPNDIHSADQIFSGGILLPLHQLNPPHPPEPDHDHDQKDTKNPEPINPPSVSQDPDKTYSDLKTTPLTSSKRWKNIFNKNPEKLDKETKKKTRDKNSAGGAETGAGSTAELNINLWPFSRSRSAGTSGSRPRMVTGNRKVSSAPCSRSNSTGDKNRKWPSSPGRPGVHLGRSSPVWQAKRFGQSRSLHDNLLRNTAEKGQRPATGKSISVGSGAGVNVNIPTCIGYRKGMICRSGVVKEIKIGGVAGGITGNLVGNVTPASVAAGEGGASSLFSLRNLFTKKVF